MAGSKQPDIRNLRSYIESIVALSNTSTGTTTLGNGQNTVFVFTTTANSGAVTSANPDITLYMGSVSTANQFPSGANIDMSQWQIMGPFNDWGDTNNINTVTKMYIRNISAGSQTIIFKGQSRTIVNSISTGS